MVAQGFWYPCLGSNPSRVAASIEYQSQESCPVSEAPEALRPNSLLVFCPFLGYQALTKHVLDFFR